MVTPLELLDRAKNADSIASLLKQGTGGFLLAIATAMVSGVLTVADVVITPLDVLGNMLGGLVGAIFGGPIRILNASAIATAQSLLGQWNLGPLTFPAGIVIVLASLYLVTAYLSEDATGNVVPGLPWDIPTPGFLGPEEEEE